MKIKNLAALLLVAFTSTAFASSATKTAARLELVSKEMKSVDACGGHFYPRDFNPITFGKNEKISLLAFASQGNVMVGNDIKAFQLVLDKGIIQAFNNGKAEKITYSIDPKAFVKQLTSMDQFLAKALEVAQKDGKKKDVEYVSCASAIVKSAKKYHSI